MSIKNIVERQYRKFSEAEGSDFIASEYALFRILILIEKFKPKAILETGVGIGTISDFILRRNFKFKPEFYGTESNDFCLKQLSPNMGEI